MNNTELIEQARSSGEQWRDGAVPEMVLLLAHALESAEQKMATALAVIDRDVEALANLDPTELRTILSK